MEDHEYGAALEVAREAARVFMAAQSSYRAGVTSSDDYCAAYKVYRESEEAFALARGEAARAKRRAAREAVTGGAA